MALKEEIEKAFEEQNTPEKKRQRAIDAGQNPDERLLISEKDLLKNFAKIAVELSPYNCPENLEAVIAKFADHIHPYFEEWRKDTADLRYFDLCELERFIEGNLKTVDEFLKWNEPKKGLANDSFADQFDVFDRQSDPDTEFIDLDAFYRNMVNDIYREKMFYKELDKQEDMPDKSSENEALA